MPDPNSTQLFKQHRSLVITIQQETSALHTTNSLGFLHRSDVCFTLSAATHAHSGLRNLLFMSTHFPRFPPRALSLTKRRMHTHGQSACLQLSVRLLIQLDGDWLVQLGYLRSYVASFLFSRSNRDFTLSRVFILPAFSTVSNNVFPKGVLRTYLLVNRVQMGLQFPA